MLNVEKKEKERGKREGTARLVGQERNKNVRTNDVIERSSVEEILKSNSLMDAHAN